MGWAVGWRAWQARLLHTQPAGDVVEDARSRFLAGLLLLYMPMLLVIGIGVFAQRIRPAAPHLTLTFAGTAITAIASMVAFALNRRGARGAAARVFVLASCVAMSFVSIEDYELLYFACIPIFTATALLPLREGAGMAAVMLLVAHGLPLALGTAPFVDVLPPFCLSVYVLPLCIALQLHNRNLEQHRYEELARRKNWSATVLRSIGDAVLTCDAEQRVMFLNPVAEALTGWTMQDAVGKPLEEVFRIVSDEHGVPVESPAPRVLQQGVVVGLPNPTLLIAQDGTRRPIADSGAPLRAPDGSMLGVVIAFRDVSTEHALQSQLLHSQRLEALGQLAGGVAHDFNNLLTVIGGGANLALDQLDADHPAHVELQYVLDATKRAVGVTSQLLAFSRRQIMQPRPVELNAALGQLCEILRRLLREHVRIETDFSPDAGYVMVDPVQLEQVVFNLAINAGDAMPKGGTLALSTARVVVDGESPAPPLAHGVYTRFRVADTGVGMDEDTQSHMFEPFFTTKLRGRGTGLGLSTVYGIVQQTGGTVTVRSAPQQGTTVDVFLPCTRAVASGLPSAPISSVAGDQATSRSILVVEDDPMVRRLVANALTKSRYRVVEAESGEAALTMIDADVLERPHLLVTDVVMTGVSGVQVAERFIVRYPNVPVLFMSGYANEVLASQGLRRTGSAFLGKPFTPAQLLEVVARLLQERQGLGARRPGAA